MKVQHKDIARAIGRDLSTVHRWASAGRVKATRSGGTRLYIEVKSVIELFDGNPIVAERLKELMP